MKIGDFFVSLGVKADTKVLTEFGQKTKSAFSNVMGLKTAVIAAGASFAYMANETFKSVQAERNVLKVLEGDCETAVGAIAEINNENITLQGELFSLDGKERFYYK